MEGIVGSTVDIHVRAFALLPTKGPKRTYTTFIPDVDAVIELERQFMAKIVEVIAFGFSQIEREIRVRIRETNTSEPRVQAVLYSTLNTRVVKARMCISVT